MSTVKDLKEFLGTLPDDMPVYCAQESILGDADHSRVIYAPLVICHSIQSKIIALAFSMAAEIERDLISQRTKEALRFKKEQGITLGRGRPKGPGKSKLDIFRPEIEGLLANGSTQRFIAQRYHTTEANFRNWLKKNGLKITKARTPS